jgi:hypothetical protein
MMTARAVPLLAAIGLAISPGSSQAGVFINEFDYDNDGFDTFEWIELAGQAGTALDDFELVFIDQLGEAYNIIDLEDAEFTFTDETGTHWGFFVLGTVSPDLGEASDYTPDGWEANEIQNGPGDSIQLRFKLGSANVHLIDYEGDNEHTTEDEITELEDSNDEPIQSLYKTGVGSHFGHFVFANEPGQSSPGALNEGQSFDPSVSSTMNLAAGPRVLLHQNAPNPFRRNTRIALHLLRESMAQVAVYDVAGRCVRRLIDTRLSAGRHVIQWDGLDDTGSGLASHSYRGNYATREGV